MGAAASPVLRGGDGMRGAVNPVDLGERGYGPIHEQV